MFNIARFVTLISISVVVLLPVTTAQDLGQTDEPPATGNVAMTWTESMNWSGALI